MELTSGTLLERGKYLIISTLGRGGFGITYLAEQTMAKRRVCVKEFFPKDFFKRDEGADTISLLSQSHAGTMSRFKEKFIKEAQTIAALDHPNIIHILDVFEENNTAYYVMEYVEGGSLSDVVKRCGALDEAIAVTYIRHIADALDYIHEQKINHLDVKPGNIMVRTKDDNAILIDFGLAKHYDAGGEQTSSTPVGISHGYAPFEQYKAGGVSSFSPATDIYSLGATLYYLVTGKVPPSATDIGKDGIKTPDNLSSGVQRAIKEAMNYWREERPQSIDDFLKLLNDEPEVIAPVAENTIIDVEPKSADESTVINVEPKQTPQPKNEPKPKNERKSKKGLWLGIFLFVLAAVASFILFGGGSSKKDSTPKNAVAMVDTLASSSDTFNLAKPEATKPVTQPNNEIWYTSSDGKVVKPFKEGKDIFGAEIESNTYKNGKGIIKFKGNVTTIGYGAFFGCESLTSITIPNSVKTIGKEAFVQCSSLKEFNGKFASPDGRCLIIDGKLVAFAPAGITEYTIPNSVTTIGYYAFGHCESLKSVIIPNGVTTIEMATFYRCKSLTSVTIPNSVTTIGEDAFYYCESLKSVIIPNSVTTIGDGAFQDCSNLTSVTIPNSVKTIGKEAFYYCKSLTSVTIPNSVKTIGEDAFYGCKNLSEETKDKITKINSDAL